MMAYNPSRHYVWRKHWWILLFEDRLVPTLAWATFVGVGIFVLLLLYNVTLWLIWVLWGLTCIVFGLDILYKIWDWAVEKYELVPVYSGKRVVDIMLDVAVATPLRTYRFQQISASRIQHVDWLLPDSTSMFLRFGDVTVRVAGLGVVKLMGVPHPNRVADILMQAGEFLQGKET
jgi:hypothetical protein